MVRRIMRDDSGAVAVVFAIVFLVVVGFAALAVDVGYWYTAKRQLQAAADAAALAACNELAQDSGADQVEATAEEFAARNFTAPLESAPTSRVFDTEIGADYVKVTCETDARVFLAQWLLNRGTTLIRAQSVAKIGYLAGGRAPVPWGLAILNVGEMTAELGGHTIGLSYDGSGYWEGTFPQGAAGNLVIQAENGLGYTERFPAKDAAASLSMPVVAALPASGRIVSIDADKSTYTSGADTHATVSVELASALADGGKVEAEVGKTKVSLTRVSETVYRGNVPVGSTEDPYVSIPLSVTVTEGGSKQTATCRIVLRRANYILQDVDVHPLAVLPDESVSVAVKTLTFEYNTEYEMKVDGGAGETGNYLALDFSTLDHSSCGYPTIGSVSGGASGYEENIVGNDEIVLHIHDIVTTETGNMVGPTDHGLDDRLAGIEPLLTLQQWEDLDRPDTKQLCIVPIVERIELTTGRTDLVIVNFATFFIESRVTSDRTVRGLFIEWTAPGWFVVDDPPPSGFVVQAVHLTDENLDF